MAVEGARLKAKLTIPAGQSAGVSNWTIVITEDMIESDNDLWSTVQPDGGDLRGALFDDGTSQFALDIISIDTVNKTLQVVAGQLILTSGEEELWLFWDYAEYQSQPAAGDPFGQYAAYHSSRKGYWSLEEDPSGTPPQMLDRTSNQNHGTSQGSMTSGDLVAAQIGQGLDYDGVDDTVVHPIAVNDSMNAGFTITLWAKTNDPAVNFQRVFGNQGYTSIGMNLQLWVHYGVWKMWFQAWGSHLQSTGTIAAIQDIWTHLCMTWDGTSTAKLYVDGVFDVQKAKSGPETSSPYAFHIGRSTFGGTLDSVQVCDTDWSQAEVTTYYNNTFNSAAFGSLGAAESVGPQVQEITAVELGWTLPNHRLDYTLPKKRLDFTLPNHRLDWTL